MPERRNCFHCGERTDPDTALVADAAPDRVFCCRGCKAVSALIEEEGLASFYHHLTALPPTPKEISYSERERLLELDHDILQRSFVEREADGTNRASLMVTGLSCAACIWLIEHHLEKLPGVREIAINHTTQRATLAWDPQSISLSEILLAVRRLGFEARPYSSNELEDQLQQQQKMNLLRLGVAGIGMMQSMMLAIPLYFGIISGISETQYLFFRWASLVVATPVVLYSARPFFEAAWRDLRSRYLTMDVPVALGIGIAYISSVWITIAGGQEVYFDAVCMFTFFLSLGRFMETRARLRSGLAGGDLATMLPVAARREKAGGEELVAAELAAVGDIVLVRPGEVIPVDGDILSGQSQINEAALTGEYIPVSRGPGETVVAGTVNGSGPLRIKVTRTGNQTRLSGITRILNQAQSEKPRSAELANQVARYFVAAVLVIAAAAYIGWRAAGADNAFAIMLSVLVVTCPCALSLATPTALTAATSALRRKGFLPARGYALETLATVDMLVFDKTGTLTQGALELASVDHAAETDRDQIMDWAAALEIHSEHPIARAFPATSRVEATGVQNHLGQGLSGDIDGERLYLGSAAFVLGEADVEVAQATADQGVRIYLCRHGQWLATFQLDDHPRPDAAETIQALKGLGLNIALLSGDQQLHVNRTAKALGIDTAWGEAQPETKLARLQQLEREGHRVAVVGDGLNDLPAMAGARLSIAMGGASDLTQLRADAILLSSRLAVLPMAIVLARRTRNVIRQNLAWALGYNVLALPAAIAGLVPPWIAAIGMSLSSLIVVVNAMRLGREHSSPAKTIPDADQRPQFSGLS